MIANQVVEPTRGAALAAVADGTRCASCGNLTFEEDGVAVEGYTVCPACVHRDGRPVLSEESGLSWRVVV